MAECASLRRWVFPTQCTRFPLSCQPASPDRLRGFATLWYHQLDNRIADPAEGNAYQEGWRDWPFEAQQPADARAFVLVLSPAENCKVFWEMSIDELSSNDATSPIWSRRFFYTILTPSDGSSVHLSRQRRKHGHDLRTTQDHAVAVLRGDDETISSCAA